MLKPGTLVGNKYHIEHLIAEGGMAEVYLARRQDESPIDAHVAIKRLRPCLGQAGNSVDLFVREAQLIIDIRHTHIVKGIELIRDQHELLLVMEFILGPDVGHLSLLLKHQNLESRIRVALAIGRSIAQALSCIKAWPDSEGRPLDLVHGDISPQNIIVSTEGHVKLVDFGVAMSVARSSQQDSELLRGNMRYMSPEQRAGRPLTQASDIYSLAMVLTEIVGARLPEDRLGVLLSKARAPDFSKRYQSAEEFLADLEQLRPCMGPAEDRAILREALAGQEQQYHGLKSRMSVPQMLAIGGTLVFFLSLVAAAGTRYFSPKLPEVVLENHHCANIDDELRGR